MDAEPTASCRSYYQPNSRLVGRLLSLVLVIDQPNAVLIQARHLPSRGIHFSYCRNMLESLRIRAKPNQGFYVMPVRISARGDREWRVLIAERWILAREAVTKSA